MDEGNVDFNNDQYLSQNKNGSTETLNNKSRNNDSQLRICLIGDLKEDNRLNEAAKSFGYPVLYSEDGKEYINDGSFDTVFIFKEFSGPSFEAINNSDQRILGPTALLQCKEKGISLPENSRPLYCLAMSGLVICFTGFRKKDELNELITRIHHMGGSIRKEMASKVTHLVANSCGGNKYQYALTFRVPVMTSSWVHNCWAKRDEVDLNAMSDDLIIYKLRPFQGARVAFVGFPDDEHHHMSEVLEQNGGFEVSLDDKSCTHVVVDSGDTYYLLKSNLIEPGLERRWSLTPSMSTLPLLNPSSSSPNSSTPHINDRQPLRLSIRGNQDEDLELSPITELPSPPLHPPITTTPTTRRASFRQSFFKVPSSVRRLSMRRKSIKLSTAPSLPSSEPSEPASMVTKTDDFNLGEENRPMVVDESSVQTVPEHAPLRAPIVKAEWFWASVQNEGCAEEKDYLFEDYLEMAFSPTGRKNSAAATSTPTGWSSSRKRKRKRLLEAVTSRSGGASAIGHQDSPGHHKRRSSVSDAGLLSVSGSFLDSTASPDVMSNDEVEAVVNSESSRKALSPRHQVFLELVQTESNYVGILHTIMTMFKHPLEEMTESENALLNNTELKIIFGNLPPIYEVHRKMLDDFKWAASHWKEDFSIGNTILKYSPNLVVAYPPFVNFFETSKETLVKCDETKPRFHAFLKVCQTRPECGRQTLQDLMIRPVQRLPSISLLLNDILKHTGKSNPDYAALEQALNSIREVMTHINEDKRKTESQLVMFDIFNEIEHCPPHLVSSHRSFITRCDVMELSDGLSGRGDQLVFFLFSDVMEVCKKRSKAFNSLKSPNTNGTHSLKLSNANNIKPYKHIRLLPLSNIKRVIDIRETEECQRVFALMCRSNQELKEKVYSFTLAGDDETVDKLVLLRTLCRQMANTVCKADAENFLSSLDPQQLDIETSLVAPLGGTLSKAMNRLAKGTRQKVGRAFSFNKTPSKLKRAVSSMMSPFGSTTSLTPASQLAQMRLASCNNLNELGSPAKEEQPTYVAPLSVQPIRKNKCASLGMSSLKRL